MVTPSNIDAGSLQHEGESTAQYLPPLLLEANHLAQAVAAGVHGRRRAGMGETFWQFRPFVDGDIRTQIDWRQSARTADRLYIRDKEWEVAATAWLWCDPSSSLNFTSTKSVPTKRHRAHVLATALCSLLTRAGERVGYLGSNDRPMLGRRATELFASEVLTAKPSDQRRPPASPHGPKQCVLFSDFFVDLPLLEQHLQGFADEGSVCHLVQVTDPSETDFPFEGRTEFIPTDMPESMIIGNAASVAAKYSDLFRAQQAALQALCQNFSWSFAVHRTDHSPTHVLTSLYHALSGGSQS